MISVVRRTSGLGGSNRLASAQKLVSVRPASSAMRRIFAGWLSRLIEAEKPYSAPSIPPLWLSVRSA